jgi:uncharacterized membrane protein
MSGHEVATHADTHDVAHHEAEHEEITSPDQHRPTISARLARFGALVVIVALPLLAFIGNHEGGVEKYFLVSISAFLLLMLIVDFFLRRAGLRSE